MFRLLKNAGIDVSIYGVPKQIPAAITMPSTVTTTSVSASPQMRAPSPSPAQNQMSVVGEGRVTLTPATAPGGGQPTYLLLTPTQATAGPGGQQQITYAVAPLTTGQEHDYAYNSTVRFERCRPYVFVFGPAKAAFSF
jgi:hypothetical protein